MKKILRRFLRFRHFATLLLLSGTAAVSINACTASSQTGGATIPEKKLRVVATFLPVYLFTKAVAGDTAQVDILIKPGTEIHEYQSTPTDIQELAQSDVVVKNGLGIEVFLDNTIKSAQNSKLRVIDASQGIQAIDQLSQAVRTGKEQDHSRTAANPHVWLDPVLAEQQVKNIRDGLVTADPENKAKYEANAAKYIQQLANLNTEFQQRLGQFRDRRFITFHDAFPYLAKRYQLQQVAVVEIPEDQLSPADVKATIDAVKQFQVKALFSEPGIDHKLLDGLSKDLNLKLRPLDSLEAGQTDPQHYFTAMRSNLQTLEAAFK